MTLELDREIAAKYKSPSQVARILTENWVAQNMFCPRCGNEHIRHFENNRPVADYFCERCKSEFELKSKNGKFGHLIADGAYETMISRITDRNNPDFLLMNYSLASGTVSDLFFIPKHFFTPSIIEKRKPLSETARRAGWIGCNIRLDEIPTQGRISIIDTGVIHDVDTTIQLVKKASLLEKNNLESRGWLIDVLNCINTIPKLEFTLTDVYQWETVLEERHPSNHNIRAKIRQQLQLLRDAGVIVFWGRGSYKKI